MKTKVIFLVLMVLTGFFWIGSPGSGSSLYAAELPCLQCHAPLKTGDNVHMAVQMGCGICHIKPHDGGEPNLSLKSDTPDLCYMCHSTFEGKNKHTPVSAGMCTTCHNPHSSDNEHLLTSTGSDLCFSCHAAEPFMQENQHTAVTFGMCSSCHDTHVSENEKLLVTVGKDLCYTCHNEEDFIKKNIHPPMAYGNCTICHNPHSSKNVASLEKPIIDLCSGCHEEEASGKHIVQKFGYNHPVSSFQDPSREDRQLSCTSCHGPHASDSELLFPNIDTSPENLCLMCHKK